MRVPPAPLWILLALTGAGCGSPSPREDFETDVAPILEATCLSSVCHGVRPDAEARGEVIDWSFFHVRLAGDGTIADLDQAYATVKGRINTTEHPELSTFLQKPLAVSAGGEHHVGGSQFSSRRHRDYRVIADWIAGESDGGEGREELTDTEQLFGDTVLPHLGARQCMNASCHGATAPFTAFAPPVMIDGAPVFSKAHVQKSHHAARMHLFLGGDPRLSRLVRKTLPIEQGGIAHRGGNDIFFPEGPSDPAVQAIVAWADAERATALSAAPPKVTGIVFVRGPVATDRPFAFENGKNGSDLWVLEPATAAGKTRSLTAKLHSAPADVRDPSVRHDGKRIVFAMRRDATEALNIWEVDLDGSNPKQLTKDAAKLPGGGIAANAQPTYGPDGRVYFVSTRTGALADGFDQLDTDVWAVDPSSGALEQLTHDPFPAATPAFFGVGKSYGTLGFTLRRTLGGRFEAPVLRMPLDHNKKYHGDPELHIHHGITKSPLVNYATRVMPDGRFASVLLGKDNVWRGGQLAVFDRQFGPDMAASLAKQSATGGFRHAFAEISAGGVTAQGQTQGFYRHPVPMPDGSLLVTKSDSALDLNDPTAEPELGLRRVVLAESRELGGPRIESEKVLLDEPGVAEYDAEPIVARPPEDDPTHEPGWDSERLTDTGTVAFRHVETLEAIMQNLEQHGAKKLRDDLVYLRLIESVAQTPNEHSTTPVGLGPHGRTRILGEVPLSGGSVYLTVPADTPFRVQLLNKDHMAVGAQHNRFNHVAPGEKFPGGVSPELYPALCSGCHGAISGKPADVGGPVPDIVTAASLTLATHENGDARRPLEPVAVGGQRVSVSFAKDIKPLLERSCQNCHGGQSPKAGLDLTPHPSPPFDAAYLALLQQGSGSGSTFAYVDSQTPSAHQSHLIERLYGRELGAARSLGGKSCVGEPPLNDDERSTFVRWVDLGAPYRGVTP
ncbi:MAG: PD40 domain-containing protein [Myxococcales bacterium]|nr:PD40 domain-containing protein [Myxococcales bacterium]